MKRSVFILFLFLTFFVSQNTKGQISTKHASDEVNQILTVHEKLIKNMQDSLTIYRYKLKDSELSLKALHDKVDNISYMVDLFLKFFTILLTITFGGAVAYTIIAIRAIKNSYENKYKENFEQLAQQYSERIKDVIIREDYTYKIRTEKKILILNQKGTGMTPEFNMIIRLFKNTKPADITSLAEALKIDYSKYDLVIIENYDEKGRWEFSAKDDDTEEIKTAHKKVNNQLIKLANFIAPQAALLYFGPQEAGKFPADKTHKSKQHLISFSNTPATLYGNIIDLLTYKDIIEGKVI